jgi:hypothetical protein
MFRFEAGDFSPLLISTVRIKRSVEAPKNRIES